MVEKFAEIQAILNRPMPLCMKKVEKEDIVKTGGRLLMNTGGADQPSEESIQSQGEQLQPQDSPEQRDSLDENVLNQPPKDANLQLKDYQPLAITPAQETPRPHAAQDMARPTKHRSRPAQNVPIAESSSRQRRGWCRPAYLTDYNVT